MLLYQTDIFVKTPSEFSIIDAMNIDLEAFKEFYRKVRGDLKQ